MHVIVIGCGKVGSSLARTLISQGHDVVIVENDSALIQQADDIECIKVTGVPIDRDVLRQAGIETADVVCAVTQNDNINIMTSEIAREVFGIKKIIARIFNPTSREVFEQFGLNTICSTDLTVNAFMRAIEAEGEETYRTLYSSNVLFTVAPIAANLVGENVMSLSTNLGNHIFGILRKGRLILVVPGLKIQAEDQIVLAAIQ